MLQALCYSVFEFCANTGNIEVDVSVVGSALRHFSPGFNSFFFYIADQDKSGGKILMMAGLLSEAGPLFVDQLKEAAAKHGVDATTFQTVLERLDLSMKF